MAILQSSSFSLGKIKLFASNRYYLTSLKSKRPEMKPPCKITVKNKEIHPFTCLSFKKLKREI